jgi:hypothetical protein
MEQIMEFLKANHEMMAKVETKMETQIGSLASQMKAGQGLMKADLKAQLGSLSSRMETLMDISLQKMKAC